MDWIAEDNVDNESIMNQRTWKALSVNRQIDMRRIYSGLLRLETSLRHWLNSVGITCRPWLSDAHSLSAARLPPAVFRGDVTQSCHMSSFCPGDTDSFRSRDAWPLVGIDSAPCTVRWSVKWTGSTRIDWWCLWFLYCGGLRWAA